MTFWGKLAQWIKQKLNITLVIDNEMQLFGILDYNMSALNLILLLCRFHIYKTKMQGGLPSIQIFKRDIIRYFSLEKYIFIKNGNILKFRQKWNNYYTLLSDTL